MIRSVAPLPAPSRHSASAAALPSFSTPAGKPEPLAGAIGEMNPVERQVHGAKRDARAPVDVERDAVPDRGRAVREQVLDDAVDRAQHLRLVPSGVAISIVRPIVPSRATRPARIFVPPRSTPITRSSLTSRLR